MYGKGEDDFYCKSQPGYFEMLGCCCLILVSRSPKSAVADAGVGKDRHDSHFGSQIGPFGRLHCWCLILISMSTKTASRSWSLGAGCGLRVRLDPFSCLTLNLD